jgi:hypothetical protein
VSLKGRLKRHPLFKEPVQLRLDGLPAGVTLASPPKPVSPEAAEFQLDLRADMKAAAVTAALKLTASATIAGAAYSQPPLAVSVQVGPAK